MVDIVASRSYFIGMRAVGLKILKNKLSEYVRIAAAGETVLVTDRDRVVVEINPPGAGRAETLSDALLADVVRKGWLAPPSLPADGPIPRKPVCQWQELQSELSADRDDR
jgi:antitoxin (DNA-binding transcriptional repressor) of toxin-antitoxin stability system